MCVCVRVWLQAKALLPHPAYTKFRALLRASKGATDTGTAKADASKALAAQMNDLFAAHCPDARVELLRGLQQFLTTE